MAEFKESNLIEQLEHFNMLTEDAWSFVDACMDDYCVDEYEDGEETMYELRSTLMGQYANTEFPVTQTYYANIFGMAAVIEHLALVNTLMLEHHEK